jgi:hypothetical protein
VKHWREIILKSLPLKFVTLAVEFSEFLLSARKQSAHGWSPGITKLPDLMLNASGPGAFISLTEVKIWKVILKV